MSSPIMVSWSIAYDYIMQYDGHFADHILADKIDQLNVCYTVDQLHRYQWWTASNICYNLNLLWQNATILWSVGYDYDLTYLESFSHIDISSIVKNQFLTTASFFGTSDCKANQLMFFSPGAMSDSATIVPKITPDLKYVIIAPDDPHAMMLRLTQCTSPWVSIFFDPWQQISNLTNEQLQLACTHANCIIVNEYEFELLKSKTGYTIEQMCQLVENVIVTLGKEWSTRYTRNEIHHTPSFGYEWEIYPTGAGDAYRAWLLYGLIQTNGDRNQAMRMGSLMGRYAIQHNGAQTHRFALHEFTQKLEKRD
jgi:adenosine kinase